MKEYNIFKNKSFFLKIFNLVDVNDNLFGMNINKIIKNKINYKQNKIQNLMDDVEKNTII